MAALLEQMAIAAYAGAQKIFERRLKVIEALANQNAELLIENAEQREQLEVVKSSKLIKRLLSFKVLLRLFQFGSVLNCPIV